MSSKLWIEIRDGRGGGGGWCVVRSGIGVEDLKTQRQRRRLVWKA